MNISKYHNVAMNVISARITDVTFVLSTLMVPFLFYVVLRKSRNIGKYRWYILYDTTCCYAFDLVLAAYKPVILGPLMAGYSQGPFAMDHGFSWAMSVTIVVCIVHMGCALVMSCLYRFAQAYPGRLRNFFEGPVMWVYIVVHIWGYSYFVGPLAFAATWDDEDRVKYTTEYDGDVVSFLRFNGYWVYKRTTVSELFILSVAVWYTLFVLLGVFITAHLWMKSKTSEFRTNSKSYRLQVMLLRILLIQFALGFLFVYVPVAATCLLTFLGTAYSGPISTFLMAFMSGHATVDYLALIYFIAPYRRAFLELIPLAAVRSKVTDATQWSRSPRSSFVTAQRRPTIF